MATSKIKGLDEPTLEGGGGGGGMGRGSSSKPKKEDEAAEKFQAKAYFDHTGPQIYGTKSFPRRPSRDEREQDAKERQYEKYSGKDLNYRGGKSEAPEVEGKKAGGAVTASHRADGIAMRGKTRGRMC
jgi:hypothetical protein